MDNEQIKTPRLIFVYVWGTILGLLFFGGNYTSWYLTQKALIEPISAILGMASSGGLLLTSLVGLKYWREKVKIATCK